MAEDKQPTQYNLPSNTNKDKEAATDEPREALPQITSQAGVQRKKTLGRKFKEAVTGDDARSVVNYVFFDVVVPAAKNMFMDAINEGLSRALWGDARRGRSIIGGTSGSNNYVPYNKIGSNPNPVQSSGRALSQQARATHNFDEIVLPSRGEAEVVLATLLDRIEKYDVATVSDLYDLVGITGNFQDNAWGWVNLAGSTIDRAGREGYLLSLPRPSALN